MNEIEVIRELMKLIEENHLVRNIENDGNITKFIEQAKRIVNVIHAAKKILERNRNINRSSSEIAEDLPPIQVD